MTKIELFWGALCFTPIWGILDVFLIFHFFFCWYRSAKKTHWKIDLWYLTLFVAFFPSLLLLYPFNGSIYNVISVFEFKDKVLPYVDLAFFISMTGYLSVWLGRYLYDYTRGKFPFIVIFHLMRPVCQALENNIKSKRAYLFVVLMSMLFGSVIVAFQFKEGYFFNARGYFLKEPFLRPLFNLTISIFSVAFPFLALRYIQFKEKKCLKFIVVLLVFTIFFGVRALGLSGLLFLITYSIYYRSGQFSFFKLIAIFLSLSFVAVALGVLRENEFNLSQLLTLYLAKIFYGNNFSDTRDFAWILAYWDGEYLWGKTYLAALISFIPRVFSSIRGEWGISMYTNELMGFDSDIMPGLRPGMFGEAFLNFGYAGVIFFGLLFGFALRFSDLKIKEHVKKSKDIIKGYSHLFVFTILCHLSVSAGMWSFYAFLFINFAMVLVRGKVKKTKALKREEKFAN